MRKFTRVLIASAISSTAIIAQASINFIGVDNLGLTSLSDDEMSSMRGGFVSLDNNIISIGLSINTAINGETVLSTHIADFTFNNGILQSKDGSRTYDHSDPLQVVSIGDNNIVTGTPSSDVSGYVVQNSADNTHISTQTVLDIEADIKSFNQQNLFNNRLENAIFFSGY
ncbi:hypothetical protein ABT56_07170 [Photobacterium aquae]|uniref:Uncharacterized protein n=1 Tax=Photobacterium aquae TaxID=1195763 RepID=A0A0J1H570_9GAMM|nr:hypothetical protein [Photobacterium aquae]KLV06929.1 hypothetical protein ABT56_07170 [Photobacterium aquae]